MVSTQARRRIAIAVATALAVAVCPVPAQQSAAPPAARADLFLIVDCLLPGQVRRLGTRSTYVSPRRAERLSARDCQIRGGEYVEYDRASRASALGAWLPLAEGGDDDARVIVGEIYERGIGVPPDPAEALRWYEPAAKNGNRRAQINLGFLYETGLGVAADPRAALAWYRRAAGMDSLQLDETPPARPVAPTVAVPADNGAELAALRESQRSAEQALTSAQRDRQRIAAELDTSRRENQRMTGELDASQREAQGLAAQLSTSRALAAEQRALLQRLEKSAELKLLAGPRLTLVEPELERTRDIVPVARSAARVRQLVGRVTSAAGLAMLTVNDSPVTPNDLGVFTALLRLEGAELPVRLVAVDSQGKRDELRFVLRETAPAAPAAPVEALPPAVKFGRYHALIIGNNDYQTLPDLATPLNDVAELQATLQRRYGFEVTALRNATRYEILSALNRLRETLTSDDNLLIYYAGHGELDQVNQRGHWLPVDAERDSSANWIPTTAITDILNIMKARQVLLVADSCYAGALTRSSLGRQDTGMTAAERTHWLRTMSSKRSRTVLASGGLAPVMDAGGGGHSVFAKALLEVLDGNHDILDGQELHRAVAARVAYAAASLRFDQVPEYAPIRHAGHEAGEFFFVPTR